MRCFAIASLLVTLAVASAMAPGDALAQKRNSYRVVLVPLSALGSEASARTIRSLTGSLATEIRRLKRIKLLPRKQVEGAMKKAGRTDLTSCDGSEKCLVELGAITGADYVVFGEVGGLGDAQVVYLKLIGVKAKKDIRSTTLEFEGKAIESRSVGAAATRLLAPNLFTGNLAVTVDVPGASIYVDGDKVAESPTKAIPLSVGSHALRITHPEFRDFVRFVEIEFKKSLVVKANLQQFPVIASQIRKNPSEDRSALVGGQTVKQEPTPWYREWYTVTGIGVTAFVLSAVVFSQLPDVDSDAKRAVDVPQ